MNKIVYIVLVNYNKWLDTIECLESIFKLEYNNFKVIVVDNDSQNDSFDKIKDWAKGKVKANLSTHFYNETKIDSYPIPKPILFSEIILPLINTKDISIEFEKLILVKSRLNLGFAGGNNLATKLALSQSESSFIWYLNNDTVVEKSALSRIVAYFENISIAGRQVGIIGTKLLFYDRPSLLQGIGGKYNKWLGITKHVLENSLEANFAHQDISRLKIDYPIGASMFVESLFLKEVGLMSEDYFLFFEELDWAERAKKKLWHILYFTDCQIYHKENASMRNEENHKSRIADFYGLRNRLIITKKFFPIYLPFVYLSFIPVIFNRLKRKQFNRIMMILKIMLNPKKSF